MTLEKVYFKNSTQLISDFQYIRTGQICKVVTPKRELTHDQRNTKLQQSFQLLHHYQYQQSPDGKKKKKKQCHPCVITASYLHL
jgi:hypothetical protein